MAAKTLRYANCLVLISLVLQTYLAVLLSQCDGQLNSEGKQEDFDLRSVFFSPNGKETKGDFFAFVIDAAMMEMEHMYDDKGAIKLKRSPQCIAKMFSENSVKYWTTNAVSSSFPRCMDVLVERASRTKPHSCDVVRKDQEAIGFMKKCPFKDGGADKSRLVVCETQVQRLMGVLAMALPAKTSDDYTIGQEFEFDSAGDAEKVMPKGSKIFEEVKAYSKQVAALLNELGDECIESPAEATGPLTSTSKKPHPLTDRFTAQYMCNDVLKC